MSDTVSHGVQGALLLLGPFISRIRRRAWLWALGLTGGIFGALPDLLGAYGYFVEHDRWALYRRSHYGDIANILQYVPMYWLHLRIDSFTHGPDHRWWIMGERLWLELLFWTVNGLVLSWYIRIWRKHRTVQRSTDGDTIDE